MAKDNIYIIGPMGAGKSSIGVQLAKLCDRQFYDSDVEVEQRCGAEIGWIFDIEQEAGFRRREHEAIKSLTQLSNIIVSTGGGSVVTPENRQLLSHTGVVIHLTIDPALQIERALRRAQRRPMIDQDPNPEARLMALNEERAPLYASIADYTYNTDEDNPIALAKVIANDLGLR